jgi:hypothetical protein
VENFLKTCNSCGQKKPFNLFGKTKTNKDGLQSKCKECFSSYNRARYAKKRDQIIAKSKLWYENNKDSAKKLMAEYRIKNLDAVKEKNMEWVRKNMDRVLANCSKRRAQKKNAIPKWLTKEDFVKIKEMYALAKKMREITGVAYHVDHILPLTSPIVCGFHSPENLRVITAKENWSKRNFLTL